MQLDLGAPSAERQFRRVCFNIVARNQDDHVKNIAFLMNKAGEWSLSPAFDLSYSYNPDGTWTSQHQMSMNGKRENFARIRVTLSLAEKSLIASCTSIGGSRRGYDCCAQMEGPSPMRLEFPRRDFQPFRRLIVFSPLLPLHEWLACSPGSCS